jgi:hypothetical protein
VTVLPGGIEKLFDCRFAQEILGPFVTVRRPAIFTFNISPVGH